MPPANSERRAHPRILLESPALLHFDDSARLQVVVADLSATGFGITCAGAVALELERRLESGDPSLCKALVSLQLPVGFSRAHLDTVSRLAWIDVRSNGFAFAGLEFMSLAPEDESFLEQVVAESIADVRAALRQLVS